MSKNDYRIIIGGCSGSYSPASFEVSFQDGKMMRIPFYRHEYGTHTTSFGLIFPTDSMGFIIDNGLGVDAVSSVFIKAGIKQVFMLQTHFHKDHVDGLPQNRTLFVKDLVKVVCTPNLLYRNFKDIYEEQFNKSNWPVRPEDFGVSFEYKTFNPGKELNLGDVTIKTLSLNHPGGSSAFKFLLPGGDFVIATDTELGERKDQIALCDFAEGCKIIIIDLQYRDAEYLGEIPIGSSSPLSRKGWGHSTLNMIYETFADCKNSPERIEITHHDPNRSDNDLAKFEAETINLLSSRIKEVHFLREGQVYYGKRERR